MGLYGTVSLVCGVFCLFLRAVFNYFNYYLLTICIFNTFDSKTIGIERHHSYSFRNNVHGL